MAQFSNSYKSHEHSLEVLSLLREHDTFMESISTVADMGAGACHDVAWWANATTRDEPNEPLNLNCFAVDRAPFVVDFDLPGNVIQVQRDFEKACLPTPVDVMWCHNSFQYALNPLNTLKVWNQQINVNGLLYIGLPMLNYHELKKFHAYGRNNEYFSHSVLSMIYMLAVNGFDCRDAYVRKRKDDAWMHFAVFKTDIAPMDPAVTNWYDLIEKKLIHDSIVKSLSQYGQIRQEDVFYTWLDKNLYRIED